MNCYNLQDILSQKIITFLQPDEEDGFYYNMLRTPDGGAKRLKVRSMVGLLALWAATVVEQWQLKYIPRVTELIKGRMHLMPELMDAIHSTGPMHRGVVGRNILALVNQELLHRILTKTLDENEFLRPHGILPLQISQTTPLYYKCCGKGIPGRLPARRVKYRDVWRKLELARVYIDASECAHHTCFLKSARIQIHPLRTS